MDRFPHPLRVGALVVLLCAAMSGVALAAGKGDPFKLGLTNSLNFLTTLSGSVSSAMLHVVNSNTGANAAAIRAINEGGGPALELRVQPGKEPFKINSNAKVRNLNADLLDGLDASALQRRLTADCADGSSVRAVAADGSVTCEADSDTTYTAGAGLALSGTEFQAKGSPYANTIVVAKSGGDFSSVQAALASITDASASKPYLVYVAAGVYTEQVTLKSYVTLEGAGEGATILRWTAGNESPYEGASGSATLIGANNAEVRLLTVASDGTDNDNQFAVAVYNRSASPTLRQLTTTALGAASNIGVYNSGSSPTMQEVRASASGGSDTIGVYNSSSSSPTMQQVTASASGSGYTIGVRNISSSPTMQEVRASASGGANSYAVYNDSSSPTMQEVTATASGGAYNAGVVNSRSSPTMQEVTATASGGGFSYGVYNDSSSPTMEKVTATASRGSDSNYGVYNYASSPTIRDSAISGGTNSIFRSGGTVKVANSQLSGQLSWGLACFNNYDAGMNPINCSDTP